MPDIKLLNVRGRELLTEVFYFYDGETSVDHGVITIPSDRVEWVQRAYIMGYRLDPETEQPLTLDEALSGTRPVVEAESTESAGDDVEGSDVGGQPAGEDGVRESELEGDAGIPEEGMDSGIGDGAELLGTGEPTE